MQSCYFSAHLFILLQHLSASQSNWLTHPSNQAAGKVMAKKFLSSFHPREEIFSPPLDDFSAHSQVWLEGTWKWHPFFSPMVHWKCDEGEVPPLPVLLKTCRLAVPWVSAKHWGVEITSAPYTTAAEHCYFQGIEEAPESPKKVPLTAAPLVKAVSATQHSPMTLRREGRWGASSASLDIRPQGFSLMSGYQSG